MSLLSKALLKKIPSTHTAYNTTDPMIWLKFFYPNLPWTWYLCGYDPDTELAWGLIDVWETKIGGFSLHDLRQTKSRFRLSIERDHHFKPLPLSQLAMELKQQYPDRIIWGWSD